MISKTFLTSFFLLISLFLSSGSIAQNKKRLLEKAYKQNSKEKLQLFFENWHREIKPVTTEELASMSDTLKNAYKAFACFYSPEGFSKFTRYAFSYERFSYLLLQDGIKVNFREQVFYASQEEDSIVIRNINRSVADSATKQKYLQKFNGKLDQQVKECYRPDALADFPINYKNTIINFRPQTGFSSKTPLYLTSPYAKALINFLGGGNSPGGRSDKNQDEKALAESELHKDFLESFINVNYSYWGSYWSLYSYPLIYAITFDKHMNYALLDFNLMLSGGEALLKNENGNWVVIYAHVTKHI